MDISQAIYGRSQLLLGEENILKLSQKKVIIFGVGGVGSWVSEGLLRTGVTNLTLVDSDCVCVTNVNRQMMATTQTIGNVKVEALKARLLEINPNANITAIQDIYNQENAEKFHIEQYDAIVDAIDSLKDKATLILNACKTKSYFISSMGAALKLDPTKIKVDEFWKVKGCPLARALRQRFKRDKTFPSKKFQCVFSEEVLENKGVNYDYDNEYSKYFDLQKQGREDLMNHDWSLSKAQINGSLVHITGIYGFMISGLIIKELIK